MGHHLRSKLFTAVTALLSFVLVTVLVSYMHEPWRDEYQALLIGRAGTGLTHVIELARYEGHPSLWYLLMYMVSGLPQDVVFAKFLSILFITAAAWLVLFRSPFDMIERVLIVAGYFFLYEYAAFFRMYGLTTLLVLWTMACLTNPYARSRYSAIIPLSILPFTQVYGLIIGLACTATLLVLKQEVRTDPRRMNARPLLLVPLCASALAVVDMIPATDGSFHGMWQINGHNLLRAAGIPLDAMIPIAVPRIDAWNSPLIREMIQDSGSSTMYALLSVIFWGLALLPLRRSRAAMVLFFISSIGIMAFSGLRYHGFLRHHGMLFVAYIASHWLMRAEGGAGRRSGVLWSVVLVAQVIAAVQLVSLDLRHTFSGANSVSDWLHEQGMEHIPIVAAAEHCAISVAGATDRPVFYPSVGAASTYINWNDKRRWGIPMEEHLSLFKAMAARPKGALLLTATPLDSTEIQRYDLQEIHRSPQAIQNDERFGLYISIDAPPPMPATAQ